LFVGLKLTLYFFYRRLYRQNIFSFWEALSGLVLFYKFPFVTFENLFFFDLEPFDLEPIIMIKRTTPTSVTETTTSDVVLVFIIGSLRVERVTLVTKA